MSEPGQIILGVCFLIVFFCLIRKVHARSMERIYILIVKDLEGKGALPPTSAVRPTYAKKSMFQFGRRDYRPKALEYLVLSKTVGITDRGNYYLQDEKFEL